MNVGREKEIRIFNAAVIYMVGAQADFGLFTKFAIEFARDFGMLWIEDTAADLRRDCRAVQSAELVGHVIAPRKPQPEIIGQLDRRHARGADLSLGTDFGRHR